jgi:hypothetical protein
MNLQLHVANYFEFTYYTSRIPLPGMQQPNTNPRVSSGTSSYHQLSVRLFFSVRFLGPTLHATLNHQVMLQYGKRPPHFRASVWHDYSTHDFL